MIISTIVCRMPWICKHKHWMIHWIITHGDIFSNGVVFMQTTFVLSLVKWCINFNPLPKKKELSQFGFRRMLWLCNACACMYKVYFGRTLNSLIYIMLVKWLNLCNTQTDIHMRMRVYHHIWLLLSFLDSFAAYACSTFCYVW